MNIPDFRHFKTQGKRITMLTCYDAAFAALLQNSGVDAVLVGDSAAMVVHGMDSTLGADVAMIEAHVRAVRRGGPELCIVADMPFLSTRKDLSSAVEAAGRLMIAGANAVKIEGLNGHETLIPHLIDSGIPVMGHLGLTPQSVHNFGGYKLQGKKIDDALRISQQARELEKLGCFAVVLECVPDDLAADISHALEIPTIGIGAGVEADGQILVLYDMLGLTTGRKPRFVRSFADTASVVSRAVADYVAAAREGSFPNPAESYGPTAGLASAGEVQAPVYPTPGRKGSLS